MQWRLLSKQSLTWDWRGLAGPQYGCRLLIQSLGATSSRSRRSRHRRTTSSDSSRCLASRSSGTATATSNSRSQPRSGVPSVGSVVSAYLLQNVGRGDDSQEWYPPEHYTPVEEVQEYGLVPAFKFSVGGNLQRSISRAVSRGFTKCLVVVVVVTVWLR